MHQIATDVQLLQIRKHDIEETDHATSGGAGGILTLYDPKTGKKLRDLVGHTGDVWAVAPSPDSPSR